MCCECGMNPCSVRCPNSDDKEVFWGKCAECGESLYEGDNAYFIGDEVYCEDCVDKSRGVVGE